MCIKCGTPSEMTNKKLKVVITTIPGILAALFKKYTVLKPFYCQISQFGTDNNQDISQNGKISVKLPKSQIFPTFLWKKSFNEHFEENVPNVGTVPRM